MRLPAILVVNPRHAEIRASTRRWSPLLWIWILVGVAWAVTLLAVFTRHTEWGDHHYLLQASELPLVSALGFFLASWQLMILAMMLPSVASFLRQLTSAARNEAFPRGFLAMYLAGYDLAWTAFGCVAFFGDALLHEAVENWSWLGSHNTLIATGLLALAGVYQFTPHKTRFLRTCQSEERSFSQPQSADMTRLDTACRAGVRAGCAHLGSCWALMLVMFGVGMGNLVWMVALTGVMAAEQWSGPRAIALRWSVGLVLCALAALTLALSDRAGIPGLLVLK
jgi:predicted metal-binding membrane protein